MAWYIVVLPTRVYSRTPFEIKIEFRVPKSIFQGSSILWLARVCSEQGNISTSIVFSLWWLATTTGCVWTTKNWGKNLSLKMEHRQFAEDVPQIRRGLSINVGIYDLCATYIRVELWCGICSSFTLVLVSSLQALVPFPQISVYRVRLFQWTILRTVNSSLYALYYLKFIFQNRRALLPTKKADTG